MLAREEARRAVGDLFGRIHESPFETLGRFAAWLGMSYTTLRVWESRRIPNSVLAYLLGEACTLPLSDWLTFGEQRDRLHEDDGSLKPIWAIGLVEDLGVNPGRTRSWKRCEPADAEERLAIILCLSREQTWQRRYWNLTIDHAGRRVPEEYTKYLKNLSKLRRNLGYTVEDVGNLIGANGSIESWETGKRGYNWQTHRPMAWIRLYEAFLKRLPPKEN